MYARMVHIFHNIFNNRITDIIRIRISDTVYSGILRLSTVSDKKVLKTYEIMLLSIKYILLVDTILSDENGLTVFQKVLLSENFLTFGILKYSLFTFLERETQ